MCFSQKWSQNVSKLLLFNISVLNHVVDISKVEKSQTCEMRTDVTQKTRHRKGLKFGMLIVKTSAEGLMEPFFKIKFLNLN